MKLRTFKTPTGKEPMMQWLSTIKDPKTLAIINTHIRRLSFSKITQYPRVGEGVAELKIHYGAGYRVYFGTYARKYHILLTGGSKRTQKQDIQKAISYWRNFMERTHA